MNQAQGCRPRGKRHGNIPRRRTGRYRSFTASTFQAAWGVTDFTLYYGIGDRSADEYRAYGDFVGRLNALLKQATPQADVLLYYPIYDLWAEYLPVAEPLRLTSQTPRAQRLVGSFQRLGQTLQRSQIPFTLIDHENLAQARVQSDGSLLIAGGRYRAIVLPEGVELPGEAGAVVERFAERGGRVLRDGAAQSSQPLKAALQPAFAIRPASPRIALGQFVRDGRKIVVLVNVGGQPYKGHLIVETSSDWLAADPATGAVRPAPRGEDGPVSVALDARQTRVFVQVPPAE